MGWLPVDISAGNSFPWVDYTLKYQYSAVVKREPKLKKKKQQPRSPLNLIHVSTLPLVFFFNSDTHT